VVPGQRLLIEEQHAYSGSPQALFAEPRVLRASGVLDFIPIQHHRGNDLELPRAHDQVELELSEAARFLLALEARPRVRYLHSVTKRHVREDLVIGQAGAKHEIQQPAGLAEQARPALVF
jgi:hypothetical protein